MGQNNPTFLLQKKPLMRLFLFEAYLIKNQK